jgi:hypothetical protein
MTEPSASFEPWYDLAVVSDGSVLREFRGAAPGVLVAICRGDTAAISAAYWDHHEALRAFARRVLGTEVLWFVKLGTRRRGRVGACTRQPRGALSL